MEKGSSKVCPTMRAYNLKNTECIEEKCAHWDKGIFDKYQPGCGQVPRESRRV